MTGNTFPDDRGYTEDHEWVLIAPDSALPDTPVKVGITSVAAAALGDLVFIDLPEVGSSVTTGQSCGEVESTKTVSELIPPVSGTVTAVNSAAAEDPTVVTSDPYGAGWLFEVAATAAGTLLTAAQYAEMNGVSS